MKHSTFTPVISALLKGREAVNEGWCKGFGRNGHEFCALEAMYRTDRLEGLSSAVAYLWAALPSGWVGVVSFNDAKSTTKADVLALYDRAIKLALEAL